MKLFGEEKQFKKTIGIGKIGQSINFKEIMDPDSLKKGQYDVVNFVRLIASKEPDTKIIYLTPTNGNKEISRIDYMKMFPNENVVFLKYVGTDFKNNIITQNGLKEISMAYIFAGPHTSVNIDSKLDMFRKYSGPIMNYLNISKVPWIHIITDDRYLLEAKDLEHMPYKSYGQSSQEFEYFCNENKIKVLPLDYGIMVNYLKEPRTDTKTINSIAVANQINDDVIRFNLIKKYIIEPKLDTKIIGGWEKASSINILKDNLYNYNAFNNNKVEALNMNELNNVILKSQFGLIFNYVHVRKNKTESYSWIPAKVHEYLFYDCIPVFINFKGFKFEGYPEQLFVNNPNELESLLNSSPIQITDLLSKCKKKSIASIYKTLRNE